MTASANNLVPNPRAENRATDGWGTPTVTSGQAWGLSVYRNWGDPYAGPNDYRYFRFIFTPISPPGSTSCTWVRDSDPLPVKAGDGFLFGAALCGFGRSYEGADIADLVSLRVVCHDADDAVVGNIGASWRGTAAETEWVELPPSDARTFDDWGEVAPAGTDHVHLRVECTSSVYVDFGITMFMVDTISQSYLYGDGDSADWIWDGTPHNSSSRKESFDWPGRYPTQVIGGNGVDVLDATWEIDRKGGFVGGSLDVVTPTGFARHDTTVLAPVEIRDVNGHLLWEGRVEEPGVVDREAGTQLVECTGYISQLEDNEAFICNFIDTEIGNWNTTQCTRFADRFNVETIDDADTPKLALSARQGIEIVTGANARAYWYPTNTHNGAMVRHVTFRVTANGLGGDIRIALYACDYPGDDKTLLWSRTTDCTNLDVEIEEEDIPATTACLVFRIEQVGDDVTYLVYGTGDPETWGLYYGAEISRIKVYGSSLSDTVTPEAVVGYLADYVTDEDHRDFPDASSMTIGQLAYFEPTTPRAVLEDVNAVLDWNYGMDDGQVFFYRKPWTPATVPPSETVVVSAADPGLVSWDVRLDWHDTYNQVVAYYTKPNGRYGNLMVWDYEGPIGGPTPARTKFLDLRGLCDSASEATTIANRVLAEVLWPRPTGSVTLKGDCTLGNGYRMPAIYLRPGMMVKNPDLRIEDTGDPANKGLMLVTAVSGRLVDRQITLTLGTRDSRMDRILARQALRTRTVKRKGRK